MIIKFDEFIGEGYLPSNISTWLSRSGSSAQSSAAKKVASWVDKAGSHISGGTTIGKSPQTLILDIKHQGSEIYINDSGEIKFDDQIITTPKQFKTAFEEYKKSTPELRKYFKVEEPAVTEKNAYDVRPCGYMPTVDEMKLVMQVLRDGKGSGAVAESIDTDGTALYTIIRDGKTVKLQIVSPETE